MAYLKIRHDHAKAPRYELVNIPDDNAWLHNVYEEIGCSCIETTGTLFPALVLILDESGKCKPHWEKRINTPASILYGNPFDDIVGDVLVGRRQGEYIVDLTDYDIERLMKTLP